jgi:hypothetical protein
MLVIAKAIDYKIKQLRSIRRGDDANQNVILESIV